MKKILGVSAVMVWMTIGSVAFGQAPAMTEGEIRKVDKASKKLTIKHGPIVNLEMPPMTMVFRVSDERALDTLKEGDRIRFVADKLQGAYTVIKVEAAN
ncbi:MAG: copper-binding protein [Betaproteobacteria bacterium]|nr:copper-binding protein [Betaproteobacteria bacterium]